MRYKIPNGTNSPPKRAVIYTVLEFGEIGPDAERAY